MTFNLDWIEKYYQSLPGKMTELRKLVNRPLTYTEKILYAHLSKDMVEYFLKMGYTKVNDAVKKPISTFGNKAKPKIKKEENK